MSFALLETDNSLILKIDCWHMNVDSYASYRCGV